MFLLIPILGLFGSFFVSQLALQFLDFKKTRTTEENSEQKFNIVNGMKKSIWAFPQMSWKRKLLVISISLLSSFTILRISLAEYKIIVQVKLLGLLLAVIAAAIIDKATKRIPNKIVLSILVFRLLMFIPEYFYYGNDFKREG